MAFGPDGYLYMGIGSLTDHGESPDPQHKPFAAIQPLEAAILRINPHTGAAAAYARGLRDPYDVTFDSRGQLYATDSGLADGPGDRLLAVKKDGHYGWPYWRLRGCGEACPPTDFSIPISDDLLAFRDYSLPRGLAPRDSTPKTCLSSLFVVL
jgi:glucose/arabinose dehydrogenase